LARCRPTICLAGEALDIETRILGDKGDYQRALAGPRRQPQSECRPA
jgi:hypothetical protein